MLSDESRKSLQKLKIVPGAIVHIYCPYILNPHEKFVVIIHVDIEDDLVLVFFINSEIYAFVRMRIPMKMDTCSNRWWTAVPDDDGHLFQSMVISGAV